MIYKMLPKLNSYDTQIFARIDDDGLCRLTCTAQHQPFIKAINEGTAQLEDADGVLMTEQQAKDFVLTLP